MKTRRTVIITVLLVGGLLSTVQVMPKNPLLIGERLFPHGGWIQVILAMLYGGWLCYKMQDRQERPKWRKRAWLLFSIVFFGQLALGIFADPIFLMTGKLHLPIPAVILAGPLYRFEGLFMPILFISTLLLSGPDGVASFVTSGHSTHGVPGENWSEKGSPITSKCDTAYYFWLCWGPSYSEYSERAAG